MTDVLVLEDNELVLDVTVQALEDAGYVVTLAETSAEALEYLQSSRPCRLVITDINLGEALTGFDVIERTREVRPDLKVIYYSGLPTNWASHPLDENARRLNKPFRFEDLLRTMLELGVEPSAPPAPEGHRASF